MNRVPVSIPIDYHPFPSYTSHTMRKPFPTIGLALFVAFAAPLAPADVAPGSAFRDALRSGGEGPEMVVIPAGRFQMGCVSDQDCDVTEKPVREVVISRPLAVSKYEVTFEDYDRFTHPDQGG